MNHIDLPYFSRGRFTYDYNGYFYNVPTVPTPNGLFIVFGTVLFSFDTVFVPAVVDVCYKGAF